MAGLSPDTPIPVGITLHSVSRMLEIVFDDEAQFTLPCEYLRVFSPSAEVRGHGGPMKTVPGKRDVNIMAIEPIGHYAVKLIFSDGHDSGLFGWDTLYALGRDYATNWQDYLDRLAVAGLSRDAD
ncbi:gamma-butyrobetaine hydroxylase-like domain-containing protein [Chitinimonas sp. PSY-7]|uniref:gamma-butyrobetaine hydroxylase-like domain-containing protein n=1 Tax=Chitinimonas sp. PSY-7 TaxID=3459088 RepID=UPI00403FD0BD